MLKVINKNEMSQYLSSQNNIISIICEFVT